MTELLETTRTIKALSLWQPWASLMARGVKCDETRHWPTAYRGPIAIHAAKRLDLAGAPARLCMSALGISWWHDLPQGAVVAIGELTACRPAEQAAEGATRANATAGNFCYGRFAWRVEAIRPVREPIPLLGRQGLFNWSPPADLEARLGPVRDHAEICRQLGWS